MRLLEQAEIDYQVFHYPWKEDDLDARHVGQHLQRPDEMIFKTLVAHGDKTGVLVAVIPCLYALDLKKLAKASGNKKVEMLHLRDLEKTTGYIRGGCSPVGMKKQYPTFLDIHLNDLDEVLVSAGARGLQMALAPNDLISITKARVDDITKPLH